MKQRRKKQDQNAADNESARHGNDQRSLRLHDRLEIIGGEDVERQQQEETQVVSDMVQQCIYENAHVALDQTEYQKRYDGLTERFEKAKARLDAVTDEIHQMQTQRASIEDFLKAFAAMPDELTEFTLESWHGLVDFGIVYSADDIRFTFKNGQEIKA